MRTITVLRHSKSTKATNPGHKADFTERTLTDEGLEIARKRRGALGNPTFDLVCCSLARRTFETAMTVAGYGDESEAEKITGHHKVLITGLGPDKSGMLLCLRSLGYEGPEHGADGQLLDDLSNKHGYASFDTYLKEDGATELFGRLGREAWDDLSREAREMGAENVLVVGHAVLVNALGCSSAARHAGWRAQLVEAPCFGECEGFVFTYNDEGEPIAFELLTG